MLKIAMCQINPTVGDIEGNVELMREAAREGIAAGAQVLVFPELSLTGYYPGDMLEEQGFMAAVHAGIARMRELSRAQPEVYWVFGTPVEATGPGKPLLNALIAMRDGAYLAIYAKQLLPTYDVFDERRHFEPGPPGASVLDIEGVRVGFLICEDGWNEDRLGYAANPFAQLDEACPDLVISINASPSNAGKRQQRHERFAAASARHRFPILYVNQVGGQDQLVYDGGSFAVEPELGVVFEAERFRPDVVVLGMASDAERASDESRRFFPKAYRAASWASEDPLRVYALPLALPEEPAMELYRQQIILGLRDYARRCGFARAVVGSSGGIDSAVTLALAVQALGPENVVGITMPSAWSSDGSVSDSAALCANLGIKLISHPIRELVSGYRASFVAATGEALEGLALENVQARIRGTILMEYSNAFGHLLLTTGNKSELSVGYCTLYGDTNGGLGLLGDLYKTEVFELARYLNEQAGREIIPQAVIDKPPSAELAPGQRDADSLPAYELLDAILKVLIEGMRLPPTELGEATGVVAALLSSPDGAALVARIRNMLWRSEYKRRQAAPVIRLRARAFGSGRQMPIAAVHGY